VGLHWAGLLLSVQHPPLQKRQVAQCGTVMGLGIGGLLRCSQQPFNNLFYLPMQAFPHLLLVKPSNKLFNPLFNQFSIILYRLI